MEKTIEKGWKEIKAHLLSLVKKNNEENLQNWLERVQYCLERMGAMEFGMDFEHNIKVFLGLDNVYHEIQDKIVKETLVQGCSTKPTWSEWPTCTSWAAIATGGTATGPHSPSSTYRGDATTSRHSTMTRTP